MRAHIPYGPLGDLEVKLISNVPVTGHRIGALTETEVADYSGAPTGWYVPSQDVYRVTDHAGYKAEQLPPAWGPNTWVVRTPHGAVAACPMPGASGSYRGSKSQAEAWARKLNERYGG